MTKETKLQKTEDKINDLEKELLDTGIAEQRRREICILLGKYHDLYAWEETSLNSGKKTDEKLRIKEKHYRMALQLYTKAGYENGSNSEISRLATQYSKLAFVYQEMGALKSRDFLECSKKADELLIKCGRKRLKPTIRQLTEEEKKQELENSKHPMAVPYKTYP